MPDITKCTGDGCPQKHTCYRYTSLPDPLWQSWFTEVPGYYLAVYGGANAPAKVVSEWECEHYLYRQ